MNSRAKELFEQAKLLSDEERSELGHELLATVDTEHEEPIEDIETAWAQEIEKRTADLRSGNAHAIPVAEAMARLRARVGG